MISIMELTKIVEDKLNVRIQWELGRKYTALNKETGEVVAVYDPRKGTLTYKV